MQCGKTKVTGVTGERPGIIHGVVVELPLQTQPGSAKVIIRLWGMDWRVSTGIRFLPYVNRFTDAVAVDIHPHHRPILLPAYRLEVYHPSHGSVGLEMIEPILSLGRIHKSALMGTVDGGGSALQYHPLLVGTINVTRAEHRLPSLCDPSFGDADVIVAVAFEHLGTLCHRSGVDGVAIIQQGGAIAAHAVEDDGAGTVEAMCQVGIAIVVPQGTGVFPFFDSSHQ